MHYYTLSSGKYGTRRQGLECVPVGRRRLPNLFREKALPILPRVSYNSPFHLSFNSESQWFTTLQSKQYNYSVHDTKSRSYKQWDLLWKLYCSLSFLSFHQGNLTNLGQMVDIFFFTVSGSTLLRENVFIRVLVSPDFLLALEAGEKNWSRRKKSEAGEKSFKQEKKDFFSCLLGILASG